ncbi:methanol dehydrogenase [alpha proteobacterium AAP81b]|nr:methanol dehydrogenase [alpha proteobacterium AAP81b]
MAAARYARTLLTLLAAWIALAMVPALAAPAFPTLSGRVTDAAGVLPAGAVAELTAKLEKLQKDTSIQLVVATIPDLQGYAIEDYGYELGRAWGIGQKGSNNGALLLIAPNDKKVRIEVGYGLEGVLTDALTSQIIRREIVPRFKAGDLAGGVTAGSDALISYLELPPEQRAQAAAAAGSESRQRSGPKFSLGALVWLAIILIWIFFSVARGGRGRRSGPVVIWGPGIGGGWGGGGGSGFGSGGGGWGDGGGGGFSGGGGSFGGGGASGSW